MVSVYLQMGLMMLYHHHLTDNLIRFVVMVLELELNTHPILEVYNTNHHNDHLLNTSRSEDWDSQMKHHLLLVKHLVLLYNHHMVYLLEVEYMLKVSR